MPSRAVDAFIYVWKMLDQHWAKTKLARQCVRTANSLILNLLKLFLFYNFIHVDFARPCQSVPIDSAPRASQAKKRQTLLCEKAGDANYAIGFGPCRIFCCCFSVRENYHWTKSHGEERDVFWGSRILEYSWIFYDILVFACLNYVKKSYPPCVHSNCQPLAWKRPLWHKVVICYFLFASDISWQCLVCSWVFWRFFLSFHARGKSLTKPSHTMPHWGRPLPNRGEPHNGGLPGRVGFLPLGLRQSGREGVENDQTF